MAVGGNTTSNGSAKTDSSQSANTHTNEAPGFNPNGQNRIRVNSIGESLLFRQGVSVPEHLKNSIDEIYNELEEIFSSVGFQKEEYPTVPSVIGFSVIDDAGVRHVALLAFTELMSNDLATNEPASNKLTQVYQHFNTNNTRVIENLVLMREDVESRIGTVKQILRSAFIRAINPQEQNYTVNDFTGLASFEVRSSNLDEVKAFLAKNDPSSVPPRCEIGFIASLRVRPEDVQKFSPDMQSLIRQLGLDRNVGQPYLAVAAAVDWIGPAPSQQQPAYVGQQAPMTIRPIIRFTAIQSTLGLPSDPLLALIIGQDIFVNCGVWKRPARAGANPACLYSKDKNDPSQGLLDIPFDQFIAQYPQIIERPAIVVDVPVGRHTIDFLYNLTDPSSSEKVVRVAEHALLDRNNTISSAIGGLGSNFQGIGRVAGFEYQGVIQHRGVMYDSREVTRLKAIKDGAGQQDRAITDALVPYSPNPLDRFRAIELINGAGSFRPLYSAKLVLVEPVFLQAAALAFRNSGMIINDLDNLPREQELGTMDVSMFNGFGVSPSTGTIFSNGFGQQNYGPTPTWTNPMGGYNGPSF